MGATSYSVFTSREQRLWYWKNNQWGYWSGLCYAPPTSLVPTYLWYRTTRLNKTPNQICQYARLEEPWDKRKVSRWINQNQISWIFQSKGRKWKYCWIRCENQIGYGGPSLAKLVAQHTGCQLLEDYRYIRKHYKCRKVTTVFQEMPEQVSAATA